MERRDFLNSVGITVAVACAGCLDACTKAANVLPAGGSTKPQTLDLTKVLLNVGDSLTVQGVIVVRLATGNIPNSFTAVQASCTHAGGPLSYIPAQGLFYCPIHGSEFATNGAVLVGPAVFPLHEYQLTISNNILTIGS